ncbi:MAG: hypothetical protein ACM3JB_00255, partial [Acidobacteriaceae bacterium]
MKKRAIRDVRKVTLNARSAARRFRLASMANVSRGDGWRAVALFWRRRAKPAQNSKVNRITLMHTIDAPRVHLHFRVHAITQAFNSFAAKRAEVSTSPRVYRQTVVNRYQTNVRVPAA